MPKLNSRPESGRTYNARVVAAHLPYLHSPLIIHFYSLPRKIFLHPAKFFTPISKFLLLNSFVLSEAVLVIIIVIATLI